MLRISSKTALDADLIIVGGGPAGSAFAIHMARAGYQVVVLEAEKFPRDKVCGDGVSAIAMQELIALGVTERKGFSTTHEINRVGLFLNDEKIIIPVANADKPEAHARIIPRLLLDKMIYDTARHEGVKYEERARFVSYRVDGEIVVVKYVQDGKEKERCASLLVGADGSRSRVRNQLSGQRFDPHYQLLGLRAYYSGLDEDEDMVSVFFSKESFPGIIWSFPLGKGRANVGMALVSETFPEKQSDVRGILMNQLKQQKSLQDKLGSAKLEGKIQGWPISFFNPKTPLVGTRTLLIGEAAGLINPLSGDGIQYALLSARWAAESFAKLDLQTHAQSGLKEYKMRVAKEVGLDFALSNLLVQFPRNKTLQNLWYPFLEGVIAKAKNEPAYANTIAGIFEGTYPSYKVLEWPFLLNSLKQGVGFAATSVENGLRQPHVLPEKILQYSAHVNKAFSEIDKTQDQQIDWLATTLSNSLGVARYWLLHSLASLRKARAQ